MRLKYERVYLELAAVSESDFMRKYYAVKHSDWIKQGRKIGTASTVPVSGK